MHRAASLLLAALALTAAFLAAPAAACCCPGDACPSCSPGSVEYQGGSLATIQSSSTYVLDGLCNIFGCNCDSCYEGYTCSNGRRLLESAAEAGQTGRALLSLPGPGEPCEDLAAFLNETPAGLAQRLTRTFCDANDPIASVGPAFTAAAVEILDHDVDGEPTSCAEWEIAGRKATPESLPAGGHYGRTSLPLPACKMSEKGKKEWVAMNAYLADLAVAAFKANATVGAKAAIAGAKTKLTDAAAFLEDAADAVKLEAEYKVADAKNTTADVMAKLAAKKG